MIKTKTPKFKDKVHRRKVFTKTMSNGLEEDDCIMALFRPQSVNVISRVNARDYYELFDVDDCIDILEGYNTQRLPVHHMLWFREQIRKQLVK